VRHPDGVQSTNGNGRGSLQPASNPDLPVLITGGAGFIGTNLANRILDQGRPVVLYDNLSREGVEENVAWLQRTHGDRVQLVQADVRDTDALGRAVERASQDSISPPRSP
jgi:CDP-paratose 2-epimerase